MTECPYGKIKHYSEGAAKNAAKRLGHYAYLCDGCQCWHTANHEAKKERRYIRRNRRRFA